MAAPRNPSRGRSHSDAVHRGLRESVELRGTTLGRPRTVPDSVVEAIRREREWGHSYREIAAKLNRWKIPTGHGGRWHPATVRWLLISRTDRYRDADTLCAREGCARLVRWTGGQYCSAQCQSRESTRRWRERERAEGRSGQQGTPQPDDWGAE